MAAALAADATAAAAAALFALVQVVPCAPHPHGVAALAGGALLVRMEALAVAPDGTAYVVDARRGLVGQLSPAGEVEAIAGGALADVGGGGTPFGFQDGTGADARFDHPQGLAWGADGALYVADTGNHAIRRVTLAGDVTTLAGDGEPGARTGQGKAAAFSEPTGIAAGPDGALYVADHGNDVVRKVTLAGDVTTLPFKLRAPRHVACDAAGTVYVTEAPMRVRALRPDGAVPILIDGAAPAAPRFTAGGLAVDAEGRVYVADDAATGRVLVFQR